MGKNGGEKNENEERLGLGVGRETERETASYNSSSPPVSLILLSTLRSVQKAVGLGHPSGALCRGLDR